MQNLSHWERSYSVGNWMLDNQHRNMLSLCQQTLDQVARHAPIQSLCEDLFASTIEHFSAEEKVLRLTGYAFFEQHREEHRHCLGALERMLSQTCAGKIPPRDLGKFLPAWCMGHILGSDQKFASAIQRLPRH